MIQPTRQAHFGITIDNRSSAQLDQSFVTQLESDYPEDFKLTLTDHPNSNGTAVIASHDIGTLGSAGNTWIAIGQLAQGLKDFCEKAKAAYNKTTSTTEA